MVYELSLLSFKGFPTMMINYVIAWLPMLIIAIFNATIRETTYGKKMGELTAHQISTVTGIILFTLYIWGVTSFWPLTSIKESIIIGLIWLFLTVTFEFSFGHFVAKKSWGTLLSDYNIFQGRIWILILITITIEPIIFYYF
jgi:hypothetical protein